MLDKAAIVLRDALDRCSRTRNGHPIDPDDPLVGLLVERGLLEDLGGFAAATPKGRAVLSALQGVQRRGQVLRVAHR
ncbi:MAG TPA: hypothetical protein VEC14_07215 [Reyranellaceae bacterium]|nr:hypothetical protein [Reyranellaceae bacterium]